MTHKHSRPPLALAHSLPRRRRRAGQTHQRAPTQRAENQPVWHQGTEGSGGRGEGRLGTRRTPHAAAQEAWGADTHSHSSPGLPGGRQRQREPVRAGVTGAREKLKPAHFQAPSSLPSSQSRVMSLTPRGRPRMCLSSSYDSRDQLCMVAPSTLAKITKSLSVP